MNDALNDALVVPEEIRDDLSENIPVFIISNDRVVEVGFVRWTPDDWHGESLTVTMPGERLGWFRSIFQSRIRIDKVIFETPIGCFEMVLTGIYLLPGDQFTIDITRNPGYVRMVPCTRHSRSM